VSALHAPVLPRLPREAAELRGLRAARWIRESTPGQLDRFGPPSQRRMQDTAISALGLERIATAVRAYALAAAGLTDREVAGRLGIGLHTLRGVLTSPLYRGRLRDGSAANWDPVVDEETWRRVADLRAARNRRSPGRPETRRIYALPMLECAACGRRLVGDKDRYRHLDACAAFMAARPAGGAVRGRHARIPGQSYGRDEYEAMVPFVLERVRLGAHDVEAAAGAYRRGAGTEPNQLRLARIEEERERALATYRRDRDPHVLEQTMRELDAAEAEAAGGSERPTLPPDEVRRYLENLPAWWADADSDDRRALATTLFERIRVLGVSVAKLEPTQEALDHGLAEAFGPDEVEMVGARGVAPRQYG